VAVTAGQTVNVQVIPASGPAAQSANWSANFGWGSGVPIA
jgi:hypothetical protein